jgi:hypothetical protein
MKGNNSGALELSVSTIVVVVLSVTLLIMGMVLVRNIMCSAIGLTGDINDKVQGQIEALFGAQSGEVACIGAGSEAVQVIPGKVNTIYCGINAPRRAEYKVELVEVSAVPAGISATQVKDKWFVTSSSSAMVSPGDKTPQKFIRLNVPEDAPEGRLILKVALSKREDSGAFQPVKTEALDFDIKREGLVRATVC